MTYKPRARTDVARAKRQLEELFELAESLDEATEVAGEINRYLIIRTCGYLERGLLVAARSLCSQKCTTEVLRFSHSFLERGPNPKSAEIVRLVERFSDVWARQLQRLLEEEEREERLNALVGIRNDIAHGKNQGVTRRQAWEYFEVVDLVVEWLLQRFEPVPGAPPIPGH